MGNKKEIIDSFELLNLTDDEIDINYFNKKLEMIKQVLPDLDLIGWYSTVENEKLHENINNLIPNSIFVRFDTNKRDGLIPLNIYAYADHSDGEDLKKTFQEVKWTIVTDDVEIIGLDNAKIHQQQTSPVLNNGSNNINKANNQHSCPSIVIDNLNSQKSAIKMLKDRIKVISKYVKDVQAGRLPYHEETIQEVAKLCSRFPLMNINQYAQSYNRQCNDVALNTHLAILTIGTMNKIHFGMPNSKPRAFSLTHARR